MTDAIGKSLWDPHINIRENIFNILCFTLVATVFFTNLIHLRHFGSKFQLTEINFLLLLPFIPYKKVVEYNFKYNRNFIIIVSVYLVFVLLSSMLGHRPAAVLESAGRCYLLAMFAILSYRFSTFDKNNLTVKLTYLLLICSAAIVAVSAYGYIQAFIKGSSPFILIANDYPYFGLVYRLTGPTIYPAMLISDLTFMIMFFLGIWKGTKIKNLVCIALIFLFVCALLTFSKSLVLLVLGVLLFSLKSFGLLNKKSLLFTTVVFTCIMVVFTHFIVLTRGSSQVESLKSTVFTSNRVIFQNSRYVILEANYLAVKRAAVNMISEHFFWGVGTGNFNDQLNVYKSAGLFPKKLPSYNPHSTYIGAFAENGVFAAITLIIIFVFIFKQFIKRKELLADNFLLALFLIYLIFLIEGISTDILNFRHLWLFLALALTYLHKSKIALT